MLRAKVTSFTWLAGKRPKLTFEQPEDESAEDASTATAVAASASGSSSQQQQQRRFRGQRIETPSHPGGVTSEARESLEAAKQRQKERERSGVFASTSGRVDSRSEGRETSREHDEDRDRRDHREDRRDGSSRDRERRSSRDEDRSRSSYDRDRDRNRDGRYPSERSNGRDRTDRYDRDRVSREDRPGGGSSRPYSSSRQQDDRQRGGSSSGRGSGWDTATPLRRQVDETEWDVTPARPGGNNQPGATPLRDSRGVDAPSPWESSNPENNSYKGRQGSASTGVVGSTRGGSSRGPGGWAGSATPSMPAAARPGSSVRVGTGVSTGASGIGKVRFEVEASPALTPTWKSTSWAKPKKADGGAVGEF